MTIEQELKETFEQNLDRALTDQELSFINWMSQRVLEQSIAKEYKSYHSRSPF